MQRAKKIVKLVLTAIVMATPGLAFSGLASAAGDTVAKTSDETLAAGTLVIKSDISVASDDFGANVAHEIFVADPVFTYHVVGPSAYGRVRNGHFKTSVTIPYKWALSTRDALVTIRVVVGDPSYGNNTTMSRTLALPADGTTTVQFFGSY